MNWVSTKCQWWQIGRWTIWIQLCKMNNQITLGHWKHTRYCSEVDICVCVCVFVRMYVSPKWVSSSWPSYPFLKLKSSCTQLSGYRSYRTPPCCEVHPKERSICVRYAAPGSQPLWNPSKLHSGHLSSSWACIWQWSFIVIIAEEVTKVWL